MEMEAVRTCTSICQLNGVCDVCWAAGWTLSSALIVAYELCVDVDAGDIVDDATNAHVCIVLQYMPHDGGLACSSVRLNLKELNLQCTHGCKCITGSPEPRKPDNIVTGTRLSMFRATVAAVHQRRQDDFTMLPNCNGTSQTLRREAGPDVAGPTSRQGGAAGEEEGVVRPGKAARRNDSDSGISCCMARAPKPCLNPSRPAFSSRWAAWGLLRGVRRASEAAGKVSRSRLQPAAIGAAFSLAV